MKHYFLSLALLLSGVNGYAQMNVIGNTGKVGIGTTNPVDFLHVNGGNIRISDPIGYPWGAAIDLTNPTSPWAREFSITKSATGKMAVFGAYGDGGTLNYAYIGGNSTATTVHLTPWVVFKPDGNVGIGTTNPLTTFAVNGGVTIFSSVAASTGRPPISKETITGEIRGTSPNWYQGDDGFLRLSAGGGTSPGTKSFIDLSGYTNGQPDRFQNITLGTSGIERMRIASNGNIGIGTLNPTAKLAVNGDIKSTRVKVTSNAADWPDYVFHPTYQRPGLMELEAYISKHQHLPGVPSAAAVEKEGSVDLGDMNRILLQKVEELTLYMIELKKENMTLKSRVKNLESKQ
jgi:hypothetical protein